MPSESQFTAPHPECAEPHLWSAPDDASSEEEVSEFLAALTRLVKPRILVETGTFTGATTTLLAAALRRNGRGHVHGIELDPAAADRAEARIADAGLTSWATVVRASSLAWTPPGPIDMAFLDAGAGWHRARELMHLRSHMHRGTVICVHDTAAKHRLPRNALEALAAQGFIATVWIHSPRGLLVAQPRWPSAPRRAVGAPAYLWARGHAAARAAAAAGLRRIGRKA